jgi:antirestriction protein ArdC
MANVQTAMDSYLEVLMTAIEAGEKTGKWQRPWISHAPQRFDGKHQYSGSNLLFLSMYAYMAKEAKVRPCPYKQARLRVQWESMAGMPDFTPYYGTLKQWNAAGARIKSGAKELTIMLGTTSTKQLDDGTQKFFAYFKPIGIYNSSQVEGWDPPEVSVTEASDLAKQRFDALLQRHQPVVVHGDEAYYIPSLDQITMPSVEAFPNRNAYYGTLIHELIHWTGHSRRLDRKFSREQEQYAFEELVAELGSVLLSSTLGFEVSDGQTMHYLSGWATHLRADKTAGRRALSLANQAAAYLGN